MSSRLQFKFTVVDGIAGLLEDGQKIRNRDSWDGGMQDHDDKEKSEERRESFK